MAQRTTGLRKTRRQKRVHHELNCQPSDQHTLAQHVEQRPCIVTCHVGSHEFQNGDIAMAALAMTTLVDIAWRNGVVTTIPDSAIGTLVRVLGWDPANTDVKVSTVRCQAVFLLAQQRDAKEVQQALSKTPIGAGYYVDILQANISDPRVKRWAVLELGKLVNGKESAAFEIVTRGGITALTATAMDVDSEGLAWDQLRKEAALLVRTLTRLSSSIRARMLRKGDLASFVRLDQSESQSRNTMALDALRPFLHDEGTFKSFVRACGIPLFFRLLWFDVESPVIEQVSVVHILGRVLVGDDTIASEETLQQVVDCDDAVGFLASVFNGASAASAEEVVALTEKTGALIPLLLLRVDFSEIEANANVLAALECLSRVPDNQDRFLRHEGVKILTKVLNVSTDADTKNQATRILANISYQNRPISRLIVDQGVVDDPTAMINSLNTKAQTAALMALRNLTSDDANRRQIGSPELMARLAEIITTGKSMKQRVTAAAVLGNLARLPRHQKLILDANGHEHLLALFREATTPLAIETAAAALWVLAASDDTVNRLREKGSLAVLTTAIAPYAPQQVPWASRLFERLQ